jgi:hypothetical protein
MYLIEYVFVVKLQIAKGVSGSFVLKNHFLNSDFCSEFLQKLGQNNIEICQDFRTKQLN